MNLKIAFGNWRLEPEFGMGMWKRIFEAELEI